MDSDLFPNNLSDIDVLASSTAVTITTITTITTTTTTAAATLLLVAIHWLCHRFSL